MLKKKTPQKLFLAMACMFLIRFFIFPEVFSLDVEYTVKASWQGGCQSEITITNNTNTATETWVCEFFLNTGQEITNLWFGKHTATGNHIKVIPDSNDIIAPGGKVSLGFLMNNTGATDILTVAAKANTDTAFTEVPETPQLYQIENSDGDYSYRVRWTTNPYAITYTLEESTSPDFSQSTVVHTGQDNSVYISGKEIGTYYYRANASNVVGSSGYSNTESVTVLINGSVTGEKKPFPQSVDFEGCIKPNHISQSELNKTVADYYEYWRNRYVKESNGTTPGGGYYVEMKGTGGGNEKTTSEAHGYGMITFALMAGYDPMAKDYFDGMFNMYDKHRSTINKELMSWVISVDETQAGNSTSAADGDMDIAYALILAHYQWGSDDKINYITEAERMISKGIKYGDMDPLKRISLGDWDTNTDYSTRPSDWMTDHLQAYYNVTKDSFWLEAKDVIYSLIDEISTKYSPITGLIPDFVIKNPPEPAGPNFLEFQWDGDYYYNACRYPWRITTDYAHYGNTDAKKAMNNVITWLKQKTNNDPKNIRNGYLLNGDIIPTTDGYSSAFGAPFAAACMVDPSHQDYLNGAWDVMTANTDSYYEDSINLLCQLLISGNWWIPGSGKPGPTPTPVQTPTPTATVEPTPTPTATPVLTNIALNKPVGVSGEFSSAYPKEAAVDGNTGTVWGSAYDQGPQWIYVDLESVKTITGCEIDFYNPYFAPRFMVYTSNDAENWELAGEITNSTGDIEKVDINKSARYVGVYLTEGAMKAYGIKELSIYSPVFPD